MSIESRMDEFERVSNKKIATDVTGRMEEFEPVDKDQKLPAKEKIITLPYGVKRLKACLTCGEMMEIREFKEDEVVYICKSCGQKITFPIGSV